MPIPRRAAILSFLLPGLGHAYIGRFARGLVWFAGLAVVGTIVGGSDVPRWVGLSVGTALAVFSAIDARIVAPKEMPS